MKYGVWVTFFVGSIQTTTFLIYGLMQLNHLKTVINLIEKSEYMMNQPNNHKPHWKSIFTVIFVVLINWYLLNRLIYSHGIFNYFFNLFITIFINLFILWWLRRKKSPVTEKKQPKSIEDMKPILDSMAYAKPYDEQSFLDGIQHKSENPDVEIIGDDPASAIQMLKPKQIIHQKAIFDKPIQPAKYCDELSNHLNDQGLSVDKNSIRELFASMAATKMIILKHEHVRVAERFIDVFSDFIGASLFIDALEPNTNLLQAWRADSGFKDCLISAQQKPHLMHIMVFSKVDMKRIDQDLNPIIEFATNPGLPLDMSAITQGQIQDMPKNIWFIVIPKTTNETKPSDSTIQGSVILELQVKVVEPKEVVTQNPLKLSYENFINLLFDGYELFFLEESEWKKFDQIEHYVQQSSAFKFDNRFGRQMERYTSTFMMFGGEKNQAIDSVMHAKVLRYIASVELYKHESSDDNLLALFEKLFGLENLIQSKKLLKEIQEVEPAPITS
jgi:hypothetical protein